MLDLQQPQFRRGADTLLCPLNAQQRWIPISTPLTQQEYPAHIGSAYDSIQFIYLTLMLDPVLVY